MCVARANDIVSDIREKEKKKRKNSFSRLVNRRQMLFQFGEKIEKKTNTNL